MSNTTKVTLEMSNISNLFQMKIRLPEYQRDYEWDTRHVKALLDDTYEAFKKGKTYILGTIILYEQGNDIFHIVDGQQRFITIYLLLKVLGVKYLLKDPAKDSLPNKHFKSLKSQYYIKNSYDIIVKYFKNKEDNEKNDYLSYLYGNNYEKNKNEVKLNILKIPKDQLSVAYTFFDSINSKGKKLTDYDLLKAHHLMFIPEQQENLARTHNDFWQSRDSRHVEVFNDTLRQIRLWSRGKDYESTSNREVFDEFVSAIELKDLDCDEHKFNRYMQPNVFRSWSRDNDDIVLNMKYPQKNVEELLPMEIPQTIEGGDSFFLYAKRYHTMYELLFGENAKRSSAINFVQKLSLHIDNERIQRAFNAIMLLYFDKFGEDKLIEFATLVELILSKYRFLDNEKYTDRAPQIRFNTILKEVKDNPLHS